MDPPMTKTTELVDAGRNKAVNLHPNLRRIVGSYRKSIRCQHHCSLSKPKRTKTIVDEVEALLEQDLDADSYPYKSVDWRIPIPNLIDLKSDVIIETSHLFNRQ